MVLGMRRDGQGGETEGPALEGSFSLIRVPHAGPPFGFLDGELDSGRGVGGHP